MDYEAARARLLEQLGTEIKDGRVLVAMAGVPRERFIPEQSRKEAYEDKPVPIGFKQTISQPYIIALMTQALELTGDEEVLEVGTGSGYQAAVLSRLARKVVTVERIGALAEAASRLLRELGYTNVEVHLAEETMGWQAQAPYPAIMVTAGVPRVPGELLAQLEVGGRLVIPIGSRYLQELCRITRRRDGNILEKLGGCRFVPLIGKDAWDE